MIIKYLAPVLIHNGHDILGDPISHLHAWWVVEIVLAVQVQPGDGANGLLRSAAVSHF